jgi:polysaccharide biosynthesis protein PslG
MLSTPARAVRVGLCLLLLVACGAPAPPAATPGPAAPAAAPPSPTASPATKPSAAPASPAAVPSASPAAAASPSAVAATANGRIPLADPAVHVFLWGTGDDNTKLDLDLAKNGGFRWVKQRFEWRNIEAKAKGRFEWNEPDRILAAVEAHDLKVIARVDNQPQWASSSVVWPGTGPPDNLSDWTDYLSALAARYKGRIQAYEIWNEPNIDREWGNKSPDPAAYTDMLKASYKAIKAADPDAIVATAGLSPTTTQNAQAIRDIDFYQGMYRAGAKGHFDALGANAAGFKAPPCTDPAQVAADPQLSNPGDNSPPEVKRVYAFRHVEDVRKVMVENGDRDKQIVVLETGWTTDPRPDSPYKWHAVTQQQQATYLVDAFKCARDNWSPWIGFLSVIYIADPNWTQSQEQYWWSITNPDGSPRPAYTALQELFRR